MAVGVLERFQESVLRQGLPDAGGRMYAIAFDMDIDSLRTHYGDPYNGAYLEIRRVLERSGFRWQQGSTYFGGPAVNAVTCVMAAMELSPVAAVVRRVRAGHPHVAHRREQ